MAGLSSPGWLALYGNGLLILLYISASYSANNDPLCVRFSEICHCHPRDVAFFVPYFEQSTADVLYITFRSAVMVFLLKVY